MAKEVRSVITRQSRVDGLAGLSGGEGRGSKLGIGGIDNGGGGNRLVLGRGSGNERMGVRIVPGKAMTPDMDVNGFREARKRVSKGEVVDGKEQERGKKEVLDRSFNVFL